MNTNKTFYFGVRPVVALPVVAIAFVFQSIGKGILWIVSITRALLKKILNSGVSSGIYL